MGQQASRSGAQEAGTRMALDAPDGRADGQHRVVSLGRDCVQIDRRLQGISMRVAVPVRHYTGVALSLLPGQNGTVRYHLALMHRDQELCVDLHSAADDADILADWRLWSRFFRLPALVEREVGRFEAADPNLGGLPIGLNGVDRRPCRSSLRPRSRFLQRRRLGDDGLTSVHHRGEREIIARD